MKFKLLLHVAAFAAIGSTAYLLKQPFDRGTNPPLVKPDQHSLPVTPQAQTPTAATAIQTQAIPPPANFQKQNMPASP